MSLNIRYPNITGLSDREQLAQIRSYLHQLADQLNYALQTMDSGQPGSGQSASAQREDISYYELRSMIVTVVQELEEQFDALSQKLQTGYVHDDELPQILEETLAQARESGMFDGPPGFSPIVSVEKITGGHRISVTDAEATLTFDVMDGEFHHHFILDDGSSLY